MRATFCSIRTLKMVIWGYINIVHDVLHKKAWQTPHTTYLFLYSKIASTTEFD